MTIQEWREWMAWSQREGFIQSEVRQGRIPEQQRTA